MANYAFVENDVIVGVFDLLPNNWRNISNFHALSEEEIQILGWHKITKVIPDYNINTHRVDNPTHTFENGVVYETMQVYELPPPPPPPTQDEIEYSKQIQWLAVKSERDKFMREFEWRYQRYDRQVRLSLPTTDILEDMDRYMQSLADITLQPNPFEIVWPSYEEPR